MIAMTAQDIDQNFHAWLEGLRYDEDIEDAAELIDAIKDTRSLILCRNEDWFCGMMEDDTPEFSLISIAAPDFALEMDDSIQELLDWCQFVGIEARPLFYPEAGLWAPARLN